MNLCTSSRFAETSTLCCEIYISNIGSSSVHSIFQSHLQAKLLSGGRGRSQNSRHKYPISVVYHNAVNANHAHIITCHLLNTSTVVQCHHVLSAVVVALCVQVVVLDKAIIVVYRLRKGASTVRRALGRAASCSLLRNCIASIDPVSVDVDGRRQICSASALHPLPKSNPHIQLMLV